MFTNNPYAQGGWYNPQNPLSINGEPWRAGLTHPPTFGALPTFDKQSSLHTFLFSSFNPDFLNCTVTGPGNAKYFEVSTTSDTNKTTISKPGAQMGTIEWRGHPIIEAPGLIMRQLSLDFLKLSSDRTYRIMLVGKKTYAWIPRGNNGIYLYNYGPNPPSQYARITMAQDGRSVRLELTSDAFQAGLFEPCIFSTVLLFSARNID
ncbi:hypothetical protein D9619_009655 [Psilocybe cf. subviscida]|uniref:Uncharacterized protein n=1 Tax=Psilocybe cf. subviscida TaxID=2480587 RepID=A0A8H5BMZ9_9AGAR|nr:hypothetical protein D9619_009655 [Psilocybe cf. subviscida]